MKALVIVHLSSLDAYAERAGLEKAFALAERLAEAILSWRGPVYVIDQRWPRGEWSEPRLETVFEVQLQRDIEWIFFDEWREDWEESMKKFRATLIRDGIKEVFLGGVWYDTSHKVGAVAELARFLKTRFRVSIRTDLVGSTTVAS